jgi:hypothetical protein
MDFFYSCTLGSYRIRNTKFWRIALSKGIAIALTRANKKLLFDDDFVATVTEQDFLKRIRAAEPALTRRRLVEAEL